MKKNRAELITALRDSGRDPDTIEKIRAEASQRDFFRLRFGNRTKIAMVYRQNSESEIRKILQLTDRYRDGGIDVPAIDAVIGHRIMIMEDLGEQSLQRYIKGAGAGESRRIAHRLADILLKIGSLKTDVLDRKLDTARLLWELEFFLDHFVSGYVSRRIHSDQLRMECQSLVSGLDSHPVFAHRDFHSRNIYVHRGRLVMIDFQDSLAAGEYYDLASIAFDSYLNLTSRDCMISAFKAVRGPLDRDRFFQTALQRNLKALGTFGYQILEQKNLGFKKYINRTVGHVLNNPMLVKYPALEMIIKSISDRYRRV